MLTVLYNFTAKWLTFENYHVAMILTFNIFRHMEQTIKFSWKTKFPIWQVNFFSLGKLA